MTDREAAVAALEGYLRARERAAGAAPAAGDAARAWASAKVARYAREGVLEAAVAKARREVARLSESGLARSRVVAEQAEVDVQALAAAVADELQARERAGDELWDRRGEVFASLLRADRRDPWAALQDDGSGS